MKSASNAALALPSLRALSVAAALACAASTGMAADATVSITSFTASAEEFSGNYVWTLDAYQSYSMTALNAGGLNGADTDSYSANNWNQGANRVAQTTFAMATGNTVQFTDAMTQLMTGGFNLGATSMSGGPYSPGTLPNYADASGLHAGAFTLIDGDGAAVAGSITFDLYYELSVAPPVGAAGNFSQTTLNLLYSSDSVDTATFDDGLNLTGQQGVTASTSGHFSWTLQLAAGESAYYTLSGSAIAAAVPEPGTYALFGLGVFAVAGAVRRRRLV